FSLQAFFDGSRLVAMPLAQDYKRSLDGDRGPNTGGMGSITDHDHLLPFIPRSSSDAALDIMTRVGNAMRKDGMPFRGIMYGQFMLTHSGTKLIEINARFADPEGVNVLSILDDDLVEILFGIAGSNMKATAKFANKATVLRYAVPRGYGSDPLPGSLDIDDPGKEDALIYYASVNGTLSHVEMTKSRALALVGIADTIKEAGMKVDSLARHVHGDFYMRTDIGSEEMLSGKMNRLKG
ncbi:phosphoribosylamine--glycine ligase, partial [mine drainage metagenome]